MTPDERGEGPCGIRPGCCPTHDAASELFDVAANLVRQVEEFATWDALDWPAALTILQGHAASARAALAKCGKGE